MPDDVMAVAERVARLEMTVATGFSELRSDIHGVEGRLRGEMGDLAGELRQEMADLESRLRVLIEASRDEHRRSAEGLGAALERIEARLELMHQEYLQAQGARDHAIRDHEQRITTLERRQADSSQSR